jgi:hypothetical protein
MLKKFLQKYRKFRQFKLLILVLTLTILAMFLQRTELESITKASAATRQFVMGISMPDGYLYSHERDARALAAIDDFSKPSNQGGAGRYPGTFAVWKHIGDTGPKFPSPTFLKGLDDRNITLTVFMEPTGPGIRKSEGDPEAAKKYSNNAIAQGSFDEFFREWATEAKAYGKPVILRYAHEMNGNWFPWSPHQDRNIYYDLGNSPESYVAAWRHIYEIVKPIAPNVQFFWCPYRLYDKGSFAFFPGVNYVDYIGFDAYQWEGSGGPPMHDIYAQSIHILRTLPGLPKNPNGTSRIPIIVGETGVATNGDPNNTYRRSWLLNGYQQIYDNFPDVAGIIYFNFNMRNVEGNYIQDVNWALSAAPEIMSTYANLASQERFQGNFSSLSITPTPTPKPVREGYVDILNCSTISGWAADKSKLNTPISVSFYKDGVKFKSVVADKYRSDVGAYLSDNGQHGFSIKTPLALKDGKRHRIAVKYGSSGIHLKYSPQYITCNP